MNVAADVVPNCSVPELLCVRGQCKAAHLNAQVRDGKVDDRPGVESHKADLSVSRVTTARQVDRVGSLSDRGAVDRVGRTAGVDQPSVDA